MPLFEQALKDGTNGLIIAPGNPAAVKSRIRKAARRHPRRLRRDRCA
jgi:ABC-type sugar transport system substrate-binding protein